MIEKKLRPNEVGHSLLASEYLFFHRLEVVFTYATDRTNPVVRKIFKCGACGNAALRVANCGVVHPITYGTNVLLHKLVD